MASSITYKPNNQDNIIQIEAPSNLIEQTQKEVEAVTEIMAENINKVIERGENLDQLDVRASKLIQEADHFQKQSQKLRRKFWWQNIKLMIVMGIIALILLIIIIVYLAGGFTKSSNPVERQSPVEHSTVRVDSFDVPN